MVKFAVCLCIKRHLELYTAQNKVSLFLSFGIKIHLSGQLFRPGKGPPVTNGSELRGALEVTWTS